MSPTWTIIHTAVAVIALVALILKFKVNPVIALVLGAIYLGLAAGAGVEGTLTTLTGGFGEIMVEVGLLVSFGVLMGSVLQEMGAIERLVVKLLSVFGPKRTPYALSVSLATFMQSISIDVLLVLTAPLGRKVAQEIGKLGTARVATAMAVGLECGIVMMVPAPGTMALVALLGVPVSAMLIFGTMLVVPVVMLTLAIMNFWYTHGGWKAERDEQPFIGVDEHENDSADGDSGGALGGHAKPGGEAPSNLAVATNSEIVVKQPLLMLLSPMVAVLLLILLGAVAEMLEVASPVLEFISNPNIALLVGLIAACLLGRRVVGMDRVATALNRGFQQSGLILVLTGAGGCLAAMISAVGVGDIVGSYLNANSFAPVVLVWIIAALLHVVIGSVMTSAITAAGILAPIAATVGLDPVFIALAAGSGSLFAIHVSSNTFWLLQSLLGQSTRGALKSVTVAVSLASVLALIGVVAMTAVFN